MDFILSEEQRMISEMARETVARDILPVMAAHHRDQPLPKSAMLDLFKVFRKLGITCPRLPEADGGSGLSCLDYGLVMEELPAEMGLSVMAHDATLTRIHLGANPEQRERFLPGLISGEQIACTGISEPNVGSDPRAIETKGRMDGDEVVLDGSKLWISNGTISDLMVAVVSMGQDAAGRNLITRVVVERGISPYHASEVDAIGLRQGHLSEVLFENCRVPQANILGEQGDAHQALTTTWLANRPLMGLMAVGLARRALEACIEYVGVRKQFGRHIGGFQLVQEMLSQIATRVDASRLLCLRALGLIDAGLRSNKEAAMAKWFATENCIEAIGLAMQIHGASGLTREVDIERLYRDARMLTIPDGTTQIQHLIVGQELTGLPAFRG